MTPAACFIKTTLALGIFIKKALEAAARCPPFQARAS